MAILRAGPFARFTDSFLSEPVTPYRASSALPVNCAMNDWVVDSWRAKKRILYLMGEGPDYDIITYKDGPTLGASFGGTPGAYLSVAVIEFMYQAAEDTTFTVTYSVSGNDPEANVAVGSSNVFTDSSSGTSSIGGTETITLPAAIVPSAVNVNISTRSNGSGSISIAP